VALPGVTVCRPSFYSKYQRILAQPRKNIPISFYLINLVTLLAQANYLTHHSWEEELLQSFIPTFLVSLLTLLIPPILFLIAKKAHTFVTLSALHDCILRRYYRFLIVNVLVFFCIGTATLQSFLVGFATKETNRNALHILSDSFPSAGPFYVGWREYHFS
jgi:Calcium-dependent channel, 7TM region, putative phosphate